MFLVHSCILSHLLLESKLSNKAMDLTPAHVTLRAGSASLRWRGSRHWQVLAIADDQRLGSVLVFNPTTITKS